MSKNKNENFEKWCLRQLNKYEKTLLLQAYELVEYKYNKDVDFFSVRMNYPYRDYLISYGDEALLAWNKKDFKSLKHGLLHEMVHMVLCDLVAKAHKRSTGSEIDDAMENTVDHITLIVKRMMND